MTGCPRRYMNELYTGCIPVRASDSYAIMYQHQLNLAWFYTVPPFLVFMDTTELLTLRRRIKSHLLFAGIIRSSPFSLR